MGLFFRFDVDKVVGPLCISASLAPGAKDSDDSQKEKEGDAEGEEDAEKMDRNIVVRFEKVRGGLVLPPRKKRQNYINCSWVQQL